MMTSSEIYGVTVRKFLAPILPLIDDPNISEILVNGPFSVIVESGGCLVNTDSRFEDDEELMAAVGHLAQILGRKLSSNQPILEGRLPDGSRIEAIVPPAASGGPYLAIRKARNGGLSLAALVTQGMLCPAGLSVLTDAVHGERNILISGGTGSGKTSLLGALSSLIPQGQRIVVLEDARELCIQSDHVVYLEAQAPDSKGEGAVRIRDLFRATLRMRPDRIVVGEIRGAEALDLVQAMTSGHGGSLSTVHAASPRDSLHRLETMALMSDVELPLAALRDQIASAMDIIVQVQRTRDGRRFISEVAQVNGLGPQGYSLKCLLDSRVHS